MLTPPKRSGWWIAAGSVLLALGMMRWAVLNVQPARAEYCVRAAGGKILRKEHAGKDGPWIETTIDFEGTPLTDDDLKYLASELRHFERIDYLNLKGTSVGDEGLKHLTQGRIGYVNVTDSGVTEACVKLLQNRPHFPVIVDNRGPHAIGWSGKDLLFSPSGRLLAISRYDKILICDVATGAHSQIAQGATFVNFSHDEKLLAGVSEDGLFVWDLAADAEVFRLPGRGTRPNRVGFSRDGGFLFVQEGDDTRQLRLPNGEVVKTIPGSLIGRSHCVSMHDMLSGSWNFISGATEMIHPDLGKIHGHGENLPEYPWVSDVSSDGSQAVWGSFHSPTGLFLSSLKTGVVTRKLLDDASGIETISLNENATRLAIGKQWGMVQVIDVATGAVLFSHQDSTWQTFRLALSPDGTCVAASLPYGTKWWKIPEAPVATTPQVQ